MILTVLEKQWKKLVIIFTQIGSVENTLNAGTNQVTYIDQSTNSIWIEIMNIVYANV